jgi:glycosyltransferase involved in cell wall biosynthesis
LIRAFSEVIKKQPQAVLLILGVGPLKNYLAELIAAYGLGDSVFFVGQSDNPYWYLAMADVFVLSSLYEGYPNALMEAICCDVPCIATDVHSGTREILAPALNVAGERVRGIVKAEYGILVPTCSGKKYSKKESIETGEQNMADAIVMLLEDDQERKHYRDKSKERSRDLDINQVVNKWIGVIEENAVC